MEPVYEDRARARFRPRDPRTAFVAAAVAVVASLVTVRDSSAMLIVLAFVCAWHFVATGRVRATARALRRVVPFAIVIVAINAVFVPGEALLSIAGHRVVSRDGLEDGIYFALRLGVMLMAVSAFLATATPESMARGAYDVWRRFSRDAAGTFALFVFLSMSFVPLLADEFARIRVAQSFRGGAFAGGLRRRAEVARAWMVPLLVAAVHRSGEMAKTVELRGIRSRLVHSIEAPRLRWPDVALVTASLAVAVYVSR
jgi:energy-coupling factor transporter transmembrane protein EcfT